VREAWRADFAKGYGPALLYGMGGDGGHASDPDLD
jgi:hypothetical protein